MIEDKNYCDYCGGLNTHAKNLQSENEQLNQQLSAAQQEISALRIGDTCARHCEGTAYRIEARRLKSENEQLKAKVVELQQGMTYLNWIVKTIADQEYPALMLLTEQALKAIEIYTSTNSNWLAEHDARVRGKELGVSLEEHDAEVRRKVLEEVAKYFYVGNPRVCEEIRRMAEQGEPK